MENKSYRIPEKYKLSDYWRRTILSLEGSKVNVLRNGEGDVKGVQIPDGSVLFSNKDHHEDLYVIKPGDEIIHIPDSGLERTVKNVVFVLHSIYRLH